MKIDNEELDQLIQKQQRYETHKKETIKYLNIPEDAIEKDLKQYDKKMKIQT